jgi:hypothetical protein
MATCNITQETAGKLVVFSDIDIHGNMYYNIVVRRARKPAEQKGR